MTEPGTLEIVYYEAGPAVEEAGGEILPFELCVPRPGGGGWMPLFRAGMRLHGQATRGMVHPARLPDPPVLEVTVHARQVASQEPRPFATFRFSEDQRGRVLDFTLRPPFDEGSLTVRSEPLRGDAAIVHG